MGGGGTSSKELTKFPRQVHFSEMQYKMLKFNHNHKPLIYSQPKIISFRQPTPKLFLAFVPVVRCALSSRFRPIRRTYTRTFCLLSVLQRAVNRDIAIISRSIPALAPRHRTRGTRQNTTPPLRGNGGWDRFKMPRDRVRPHPPAPPLGPPVRGGTADLKPVNEDKQTRKQRFTGAQRLSSNKLLPAIKLDGG